MKKSKMLRVACVLAIAVVLSVCTVSGTFAKYVTQSSGSDSARVAKFGVTITLAEDFGLFKVQYKNADNKAVVDGTTDRLVAPGTGGNMSLSVTGSPEVATKVTVSFANDIAAITLPAGTYNDVEITEAYEPIKFYFGTSSAPADNAYTLNLAGLKNAMETALNKNYSPNESLNATYYIFWKWDFEAKEDAKKADTNVLDTYIADVMAKSEDDKTEAEKALNLTEKLGFSITIEQVN